MFKFKERFWDTVLCGRDFNDNFWDTVICESDSYKPGYEYHILSDKGKAPLLVGHLCQEDFESLEDFTERVSVLPPGVITSEKRTSETDAEAIEFFKDNTEQIWDTLNTEYFGLFTTNPVLVMLCYRECDSQLSVVFERRYPLAVMFLGDEGLVVETDIFEEV